MLEQELEYLIQATDKPISADLVETSAISDSFKVLYLLSVVVHQHWDRIKPTPNKQVVFAGVVRYYFRCIELDVDYKIRPETEDYDSRYEAAGYLAGVISHWKTYGLEFESQIMLIVTGIQQLYLSGDQSLKNAIVTGFLEHAMEDEAVRQYFEHWKDNPELVEGYNFAMEWVRGQKQQ